MPGEASRLIAIVTIATLAAAPLVLAGAAPSVAPPHFMPTMGHSAPMTATSRGSGQLVWHGGEVQQTPKVFITFWGWGAGADPSGEQAYVTKFFQGVGGSSWANIQTQYDGTLAIAPGGPIKGAITNPSAQLGGTWVDTTGLVPLQPDTYMTEEVVASVAHFGYDPNADYIIATPHGHNTGGFGHTYCAWHSAIDLHGESVAFTNLPYITDAGSSCGASFVNAGAAGALDGVSIVAGHEYAEAVTDPDVSAGWWDAAGYENGDKCIWISSGTGHSQDITLSTGTFAVQGLYSNANHDCAIAYP